MSNREMSFLYTVQSRRQMLSKTWALAGAAALFTAKPAAAQAAQDATWRFDRLDNIGGNPTRFDGQPRIINTSAGKAVLFDGVHDGLFIEKHPLAGFSQFTFEALVRPDGGDPAQRWFHLAETDPKTGLDATVDPNNPTSDKNARFTFELRIDGDRCYFESFTQGPGYRSALIDKTKTHALGQWYVVTQTYDGQTHRSFVNGVLEKEGALAYLPQGPGHSSVGVRINHVSYFKGAVMRAHFAPRALAPFEFTKVPASLASAQ
jgi:hypothetical protein